MKALCRQDECVRVKKYGTRILTLDQIEGIKVRLVHSHTGMLARKSGCAFFAGDIQR